MIKKLLVFMLFLGMTVSSGCGYTVGSLLPAELKTINVPTFINKTAEPNLEADVTSGVINEFKKDGALNVTSADKADTVLIGHIVDYQKIAQIYDSKGTASQSKLVLTADIVFKNASTDAIIVRSRVSGEAKFDIGASQFEAERTALPLAVEDLAQHIVEKVAEGGW